MVAAAETILNRKTGGLAPRRRLGVKAQLIVKVLIFMITGNYAVVQWSCDMELWQ